MFRRKKVQGAGAVGGQGDETTTPPSQPGPDDTAQRDDEDPDNEEFRRGSPQWSDRDESSRRQGQPPNQLQGGYSGDQPPDELDYGLGPEPHGQYPGPSSHQQSALVEPPTRPVPTVSPGAPPDYREREWERQQREWERQQQEQQREWEQQQQRERERQQQQRDRDQEQQRAWEQEQQREWERQRAWERDRAREFAPGEGASEHWNQGSRGSAEVVAPVQPVRKQIPVASPAIVPDLEIARPQAFPETLVIGDVPTLRSDPRGLPKPDGVPGPVLPDTVIDGADLVGLQIRGASLRGDGHRYNAVVRQDSMGIWQVGDPKNPAVLVCATDGVSKEPLSHRGAAEACKLLRDALELDNVPEFFKLNKHRLQAAWEDIAQKVCDGLTAVASYLGVAPKALSTTLAAALIEMNPENPARRRYVILNVGDATAFVLSDGVFRELLEDPHASTITSTATFALPTSLGKVGVDTGEIRPGDMLMVCTDGMSNPMRNDDVRHQLVQWWSGEQVPSMPEFGWQMSYRVKTYDDDRTAVCVWGR